MAAYFTDSSAAVKRYLAETGSLWIRGLFSAKPPNEFYAVATTGVEVAAAITRRARGGTISQPDAARLCGVFLLDLELDFEVVGVADDLLRRAVALARTYGLCARGRRVWPWTTRTHTRSRWKVELKEGRGSRRALSLSQTASFASAAWSRESRDCWAG